MRAFTGESQAAAGGPGALASGAHSMRKFDPSGQLVEIKSQEVSEFVAQVNASPLLRMVPKEQQTALWHKTRLAVASPYSRDRYSARFHREQIIAVEPAESRWYLQRADDRVAEGQPSDAIADYTKALELGAKGWQPWVGRAVASVTANQVKQAAADFAKAIELGDTADATLLNHLLASLAAGDAQGYQAAKTRLIRTSPQPGSGNLHARSSHAHVGDQYLR